MWWVLTGPARGLVGRYRALISSAARFGKHKLSPRLSPKKTWEGYLAGSSSACSARALLADLWQVLAGPARRITPLRGALIWAGDERPCTTLGDLGESMIKRQVGVKDSGNLLPGSWRRLRPDRFLAVGRRDRILCDHLVVPVAEAAFESIDDHRL